MPEGNGWPQAELYVKEAIKDLRQEVRALDASQRSASDVLHGRINQLERTLSDKIGELSACLNLLKGKWLIVGSLAGTVLALLVGLFRDRVIP